MKVTAKRTARDMLAAIHHDTHRPNYNHPDDAQLKFLSETAPVHVALTKEEVAIILSWYSVSAFGLSEVLPEELALKKRLEDIYP